MRKALILRSPFLYYRRNTKYWPTSTIRNLFLVIALLTICFVLHYWIALPFSVIIMLLLELPGWFDKPFCLIQDSIITVKWKRHTYRSFMVEKLYAFGCYHEDGSQPMLFLCNASAETIRRFALKHKNEVETIAKHYGYEQNALPEKELRNVMLTVYLWKAAKKTNPNTAVICITKGSWKKLYKYCTENQLTIISLSAPDGGCYNDC